VLSRNWLKPLAKPIWRRGFGQNKTWRGALVMSGGTVLAAVVLHRVPAYRERLPADVREASPLTIGALLGAAVVVGEFPNSYAKRRLGIPPGEQRRDAAGIAISVFDQADWVPMAWLLLSPVYRMSARDAAKAFALVAAIHVPVNLVGYAIGARSSPV
jgi:hypothetical protein